MSRYLGAAPGSLVAVDLPPGPAWPGVLSELWEIGAAILPLDVRLAQRERRAIVDLARPASVITADDEVLFADPQPVDPERAGLVIATSGSGGRPKLVELSRSCIGSAIDGSLRALGARRGSASLDPTEPWVCCLTPAHIGGMLVLMRGLLAGTPVTILDPAAFPRSAPTGAHASIVPTMLTRLVTSGDDLSRIGVLLVGGGALDPDLGRRAADRGGTVTSTYGLTESCGGVVYDGVPFEGMMVRTGTDEGLELHGPTLMDGYRNDPASTATAFALDGWLRTGDAGAIHGAGRVLVRGRLDEAIRTGAETVWPEEVEASLRDHPKVADIAVAGRSDAEWGQRVAAFVVAVDPDHPPTLQELRDRAREHVAAFKAPRELVLLSELPRTASGKIRRGALSTDKAPSS
jgi:acyl-CoA synthetase (AMP-forming)/AMP-acid ligase II